MAKRRKIRRPSGGAGGQNPAGMMQQVQLLQQQLLEAQQNLSEETVTATSGGGVVKVTITGDQRCTDLTIAPELLEDGDVEMLQDLLITAVNNALDASRSLAEERLGPLSSGLGGLGLGL